MANMANMTWDESKTTLLEDWIECSIDVADFIMSFLPKNGFSLMIDGAYRTPKQFDGLSKIHARLDDLLDPITGQKAVTLIMHNGAQTVVIRVEMITEDRLEIREIEATGVETHYTESVLPTYQINQELFFTIESAEIVPSIIWTGLSSILPPTMGFISERDHNFNIALKLYRDYWPIEKVGRCIIIKQHGNESGHVITNNSVSYGNLTLIDNIEQ